MSTLIEAQNLTKLYGVVIGVNDMTFELEPGVHGLLGPNGAGKSTLLKLVTAQLRPSEGSVRVFGEDPWNNTRLFARLGFCPEYDAFYDFMTAFEFVETLARVGGLDPAIARARTETALELCAGAEHMDAFTQRPISTYSKGMRQRTKVAQALVHDPELLILDEPLSGTDPIGRSELTRLVRELGTAGKSIIVSSHVLHEVQAMTSRFLLIFGGRVLATGDVAEIRSLMDEYPHRISMRCTESAVRALAGRIMSELPITGLELDEADGQLDVATRDPQRFYAGLPALAIESGAVIHEMSSQDDNLEAVFKYLVGVR